MPTLEAVKEWEEDQETREKETKQTVEQEEESEQFDRLEGNPKPIAEDENFLELKESPWLITKDLEEEIREKAIERGESVGVTFREILRRNLQ